ncbi:helix-turn-helix domain-containing protein [Vibrio sp. AK197]
MNLNTQDFAINAHTPIKIESRTPQESFPEHSHSFEEIIIVSQGYGTHVLNDVPMNLSKNYVCFVNQGDKHLYENVSGLNLNNVLFDLKSLPASQALLDYLPLGDAQPKSWFINDASLARVKSLLEQIHWESTVRTPETDLSIRSLFTLLLIELKRGRVLSINGRDNAEKTLAVIAHLNHHFDQPNDLESVAERAQMSAKVLAQNIKRLTGMRYNQYLNYVRTSKAMEALLYSDKSVTDIAFDVGFQDSNYFSTKFKQVFQRTPMAARYDIALKNSRRH